MTWRGLGAFEKRIWGVRKIKKYKLLAKEDVYQEKIMSMFQVTLGFIRSTIGEIMKHVGLGRVD